MSLPAYQHGRYIIPTFPILYLWGMIGMVGYLTFPKANQNISFLWQTLVVVLVVAFQWVGARQNAQDIILIESQMVKTAQWINENLPSNAILAVHDIGAIGYFTSNSIIDLAGLITPDVVPFIRDESKLASYIDDAGAEYLVTFPSWYPQLIEGKEAIFQSGLEIFPFDDNMTVYRWK